MKLRIIIQTILQTAVLLLTGAFMAMCFVYQNETVTNAKHFWSVVLWPN